MWADWLRITIYENKMMQMKICRHYRVRGIVQGVGFRYHTSKKAHRLGLAGWVRNVANGDVELVVCGTEPQLNELYAWLQHGPRMARVESVSMTAASPNPEPAGFAIR